MKKELELLAPAGSLATLKAVVNAGADAVYLGGDMFGARAYANNFTKDELFQGIDYGHRAGSKVILAINTLLKEDELKEHLYEYLLPYYEYGIDAVIVQDFGVFDFIHEQFPKLPIHTSTQMTVTSVPGARFLVERGASRIVMAREMSFEEIKKIYDEVGIEIESFVHGALCYCYSGQCLLSSMLGGRSGNRGRCAQPCRLPYEVNRDGKKIGPTENYILSPKDLCTIESIPKLAQSGVYSFKIEGRMKQAEYAAGVVSIYRKYMDQYLEYGDKDYKVSKEDLQKLYDFGNRSGFTKGYYYMHNGKEMITFEKPNHTKSNDELQDEIKKTYIDTEIKESIEGTLFLKKGEPARLTIKKEDLVIEVFGDEVQIAQKRPLTKENVLEKLKKTGNTPYEFGKLQLDMEDDIFLPIQSINQLRRDALLQLEEKEMHKFRRESIEKIDLIDNVLDKDQKEGYLAASVETKEAFEVVVKTPFVQRIYLDSILFSKEKWISDLSFYIDKAKKMGKEVYFMFPSIFRMETIVRYEKAMEEIKELSLDGFLVKSYDELGFCISHGIDKNKIVLDHNMYAYSDFAKDAFQKSGFMFDTAPLELNKWELAKRNNQGSEMIIYGYLPLMVSAQCVHKNTEKCDHKKGILYLMDRYKKEFAVKNNCNDCYNVIYNSSPLALMHLKKEILPMGFKGYRMQFTREDKNEVEHMLQLFEKIWMQGQDKSANYLEDYTNGHFKRGVE